MEFKTMLITEEDANCIREIANMKDEEYMNIQSDNITVTFSKVNKDSFKTYVIYTNGTGLFNLRVSSSLISSFIKEGVLGINRDDRVILALSSTQERFDNEDYSMILTFDKQDGKDNQINKLIAMTRSLKDTDGYIIRNPQVLSILNSLAKINTKGVLFKDSMIYTDAPGFKAYTKTDFINLEMAIGVEALDKINRIARKNKDEIPFILWDVENYVFFKDGSLVHGYQKNRSDIPMGLEALKMLTPEYEFQIDLTDIVQQLKGLKITKASAHKVDYNLKTHYFTIVDPGRSVMRARVPATKVLDSVISFDVKVLKDALLAIYNKDARVFSVEVFSNVVIFKSIMGIHLIVGRAN